MNSLLLGILALGLSADPTPTAAAFEFRDAYLREGRSMVCDQTISFKNKPLRKLSGDYAPQKGDQYALLPLGARKNDAYPAVVWNPNAEGHPVLWFDANGDGRLEASERHVMKDKQLEIPASITVETKAEPKQITRTVRFQRPVFGPGLRWTIRGYAVGKLKLGETEYDAMLVDANANVSFGTIGRDRVWIDLDRDGQFDPVVEQYPVGKPIAKDGQIYVVVSDRLAESVVANHREPGEGRLRLTLAKGLKANSVSAELINDLGELVEVTKLDQPIAVPHGKYFIDSLDIKTDADDGQSWHFTFSHEKNRQFPVEIGQAASVTLLDGIKMQVKTDKQAKPGQNLSITPTVITGDGALSLASCTRGGDQRENSTEGEAVILLLSPDGKQISRGSSGFG